MPVDLFVLVILSVAILSVIFLSSNAFLVFYGALKIRICSGRHEFCDLLLFCTHYWIKLTLCCLKRLKQQFASPKAAVVRF